MKKITLLFVFLLFLGMQIFAQTTITGQVVDQDGMGIPGATVRVKGFTDIGTITDLDGNYTLTKVPAEATHVIFTFVGLETLDVEIAGQTTLNATLKPSDLVVDEVVVTAIGIKRSEKKIGYAATTVSSDELTANKDRSALNALQGKVAGVNITTASGAPGSSSRVIFRGFSTFSGSNQPLYVINGVPINNASNSSDDLNGGTDFGNQSNDINPDDIATITFLKGSAATALYGSRASNGVIVITTKKGEESEGLDVNFSSTVKFSTPLRLPQLQNTYGQGIFGNWDQRENTSYGPRFDNELHYWGHVVDNKRLIKDYSALPTNVEDFFEVGHTYMNSVSVSGGSEGTTYYLSYSNITDDGIMPFDKDKYNRNTFTLTGQSQLSTKFSSSASLSYVKKVNTFVPTGQGGGSVWNNVLQQPRDIPIVELADYTEPFYDNDTYYGAYTTNPYWPLLENGNENNQDRVYGMGDITFMPNDYWSFMFRAGLDISNEQTKIWNAKKINSEDGYNFNVDNEVGGVSEESYLISQINTDFIATYNRSFGDFDVSVLAGHNLNQLSSKDIYTSNTDINIEGFYHLNNLSGTPLIGEASSLKRLIGAYANAEVNYKGWLNLGFTGRNDWSSSLPAENNSFFYPGVNLGFVFSDAFPVLQEFLNLGKLRCSFGQTGKDAGIYQVYSVFSRPAFSDGFGVFRFPLNNGVTGFEVGNGIASPDLQPEITTEFEIGTDLRFFSNRLKFDITYYDKTITDLIFAVPYASSTGYSFQTTNLGEINNKGIEILVSTTPIDRDNITWDMTFTFSKNKSLLVSLNDDMEEVQIYGLSGGTEISMLAKPGSPLCIFEGSTPLIYTDDQGVEHPVVNADGVPMEDPNNLEYRGKTENDFLAGITTSLTVYGVTLGGNIDWRVGGVMYSRTAGMVYFTGIAPQTTWNDRQPFIVPNSVVQVDTEDDGTPIYAENTTAVLPNTLGGSAGSYWDMGGELVGGHEMISKSFIKLRSLNLSYDLPSKLLEKTPIGSASIGFVGNNIWMWTPSENNMIDPELTTFGNDMEADFGEFGATPSVRSVGFTISVIF